MHKFVMILVGSALMTGCAGKKIADLESQVEACNKEKEEQMAQAKAKLQEAKSKETFLDKRMKNYQRLAERLEKMFEEEELEVDVVLRDGMLVLQLPSDILFGSGSATLSKDGKAAMKSVADVLKEGKRQYLVAGHTDTDKISSRQFKSNWDLSSQRAIAATGELVTNGVDPKQLGAVGFGEFRPIASNDDKAGKAKNRRVEIVFMPTAKESGEMKGTLK